MAGTALTLRVEFTSDWHVGTGAGRPGDVDRLVRRDADGVPFVPAKTLTGIWRDAAEVLAHGLDDGGHGGWTDWTAELFGDQPALDRVPDPDKPRPARFGVRPAHFPEEFRARCRGTSATAALIRAGLTVVRPGVAIDANTGRAKDDHLRFVELARGGAVLTAACELAADTPEAARYFLAAAAGLVERLGGKRRRGVGACRWEVIGTSVADAARWLEAHPVAPAFAPPPPPERGPAITTAAAAPDADDEWLSIVLTLTPTTPLAIVDRRTGNVWTTLDYIPGTHLLPHVTRVFGDAVRPAIARGDLRVLPATRVVGGGRGRPVPFALFALKGESDLGDAAKAGVVNRLLGDGDGRPRKQCRDGVFGPGDAANWPAHGKITPGVQTHNSVDGAAQRPLDNGVYSYESLPPRGPDGTPVQFRAELRFRKRLLPLIEPRWKSLTGTVRLGRSKKDDYGEVELVASKPADWPGDSVAANDDSRLVVWLLSDVVLRDERLRPAPTADALARALEVAFGIAAGSLRPEALPGALSSAVRDRRIESWHVGWGLPRPTLAALRAGSVVAFAAPPLTPAQLRRAAAAGVGERRGEGFGDLVFNDPLLTDQPSGTGRQPDNPAGESRTPIAPQSEAYSFAQAVETAIWRDAIARAARRFAHGDGGKNLLGKLAWDVKKQQPRMSQLGNLRTKLRELTDASKAPAVQKWLDELEKHPRRGREWPPQSLDKLRLLLAAGDDARVWEWLEVRNWPTLTAAAEPRLRRELWPFAVRALVDAAIRAFKRAAERNSS